MGECKIGELNEFVTQEHRIEMRNDDHIAVAVIADLNDPPHDELDHITDDLLVLFRNHFKQQLSDFSGDISKFNEFGKLIKEYLQFQSDKNQIPELESEQNNNALNNKIIEKNLSNQTTGGLDPEINLFPLIEWLKNRFNPKAEIQTNQNLMCSPRGDEIKVSILLNGGERKFNWIDRWMSTHIGKPNYQYIILVFGLNASHGPGIIRTILESVQNLGDPVHNDKNTCYPWFPKEILFIGPTIQTSTFDGLEDLIRFSSKIVVPNYADHIHREHFPHHEFYKCKITGWRWKIGNLTENNFPQQIFPKIDT